MNTGAFSVQLKNHENQKILGTQNTKKLSHVHVEPTEAYESGQMTF